MNLEYIKSNILESIELKQALLKDSDCMAAIETVACMCTKALQEGKKIMLAGNGGSAADAQHIAAELVVRFEKERRGLPAIALTTDTSMLTAIGNDFGFEHLFARQLQANAQAGDVFIGFSTSGNSSNIINAVENAKRLGVHSVAMCGAGGKLADMAEVAISVPGTRTARIQECHILIGHILCGLIEKSF